MFSPSIFDNNDLLPIDQAHDLLNPQLSPLPVAPFIFNETAIDMLPTSNYTFHNVVINNQKKLEKTVKKDRHSKIYTARGPRDRRVRLSVDIARQFFDLQEMLGYDKASKTLEWLLLESKMAIDKLAFVKHSCNTGGSKSLPITSSRSNSKAAAPSKNIGVPKEKEIPVKESRAMARARARERTREKMCSTRRPCGSNKVTEACPHMFDQFTSLNQFSVCEKPHSPSLANDDDMSKGGIVKESIMIKRMFKPWSILDDYQQNAVTSREFDSDNNKKNSTFPNPAQNWGGSSAIASSGFCAGMTNMNLSTEVQFYEKHWERPQP